MRYTLALSLIPCYPLHEDRARIEFSHGSFIFDLPLPPNIIWKPLNTGDWILPLCPHFPESVARQILSDLANTQKGSKLSIFGNWWEKYRLTFIMENENEERHRDCLVWFLVWFIPRHFSLKSIRLRIFDITSIFKEIERKILRKEIHSVNPISFCDFSLLREPISKAL